MRWFGLSWKKMIRPVCEIGSEFAYSPMENGEGFPFPREYPDFSLTFSGRTAIEAVLRQLPNVKKAMLPAYLCDSMIAPFRSRGIDCCFYDVSYEGELVIRAEIPEDADVLLWCNYFGYCNEMPDFSSFIDRGGVIIEDITHSLLSDTVFHEQSRYLAASIRKWEPVVCGGYCNIRIDNAAAPSASFVKKKYDAMQLKAAYLQNTDEEMKPVFFGNLRMQTNGWLKTTVL